MINSKKFYKGEVIISEGERNRGAFRILEGKVEVSLKGSNVVTSLAILEEGEIFGEMSLIDNQPYSATVTALSDVECIILDPKAYQTEIENSGPILKELISFFAHRIRVASKKISTIADSEIKHKKVAKLKQNEAEVLQHIAKTGAELQEILNWEEAVEKVKKSLYELGFDKVSIEFQNNSVVKIKETTLVTKGDSKYLHIPFSAGTDYGILSLSLLQDEASIVNTGIFKIYKSLLSSCLIKCKSYSAFANIATELESYMSESRINEIFEDLKLSINSFSESTLEKIMAIPDQLNNGKKIEDISFDLTIGFQEIDRLSQELDLINNVYSNIKVIASGQIPEKLEGVDKNIDKKDEQVDIDALIHDFK